MDSLPGYISPENREAVDKLMEPLRKATNRQERDEAREKINAKVLSDSNDAKDRLN